MEQTRQTHLVQKVVQSKKTKFYFFVLISMFLWGGSFVLTKHLLIDFNPISIIFTRLVIASLIFVSFCLIVYKKQFKIAKKDIKLFLGLAFFEPFVYFLFETYSLLHCDASVVSVIISTIPLFVALMAVFVFKEKLTILNFFGVGISILGIFIMLLPSMKEANFSFFGVLLAFGAVFSTIGYNYFLKKIPSHYTPIMVITWQNLLGLVAFLPLFLLVNNSESINIQITALSNLKNLSFLLLLAVFCSAIAFILYIDAMRNLGVAKTNIFVNLIPVMTAIISFYILKEEITTAKVVGIVTVILGIFMVQRR